MTTILFVWYIHTTQPMVKTTFQNEKTCIETGENFVTAYKDTSTPVRYECKTLK